MKIVVMIGIGIISFLALFVITFAFGFNKIKYTVFEETYSDSYTENTTNAPKAFLLSCIELIAAAGAYFHLSEIASIVTAVGVLTAIAFPIELTLKILIDKAERKSIKKKDENEDDFKVSTYILMTLNVLAVSVFIPLILDTIGLIK